MRQVTRNEADFDELFYYAEEHFGINWNECNRMFFDESIIPYYGHHDFDLEEVKSDLSDENRKYFPISEEKEKFFEILIHFMKAKNISELRIYGSTITIRSIVSYKYNE